MAVELLEAPIKTTSRSEISVPPSELSPRVNLRRFLPDRIRNEYDSTNVTTVEPILAIPGTDEWTDRLNKGMKEDFEYYSKTHDLEIDTDRTRIIQGVLDKLTEGTEIKTRAVIIKRGSDPNAFVAPDGTTFIFQSLLNRLDSLDEVAAVLAHEVGHLINKTSIRTAESESGSFGLGWVHEATCDLMAPQLLEKAGFASWAFSTAIEKVQGYERGTIHQSGLSRASQSVGSHLAIDRTTSSQRETPIPSKLKGNFSRTNLEIIMNKLEERDSVRDLVFGPRRQQLEAKKIQLVEKYIAPLKPALEKLHPRDFGTAYDHLNRQRGWYELREEGKQAADQIISGRLKTEGLSQAEINLFLVTILSGGVGEKDAYMFKSLEDLGEMVDILVEYDVREWVAETRETIFGSERGADNPEDKLLELMAVSIYDVNFENLKSGIPVTRETLLDNLEKLSKADDLPVFSGSSTTQAMSKTIGRYVQRVYIPEGREIGEFPAEQIRQFLTEVKDRGIKIEPSLLAEYFGGYYQYQGRQQTNYKDKVLEVIDQVFEIEKKITTEDIDKFFEEFAVKITADYTIETRKVASLSNLLQEAREYCESKNISDEERLNFARYLQQKVERVTFSVDHDLAYFLEHGSGRESQGVSSAEINDAILKLNLLTIVGIAFFNKDSDQFYTFMQDIMNKAEPTTRNFSRTQLVNLCQPFFTLDRTDAFERYSLYWLGTPNSFKGGVYADKVNIQDFERFLTLPLLKRIIDEDPQIDAKDIAELNEYIKTRIESVDHLWEWGTGSFYSDELVHLIFEKQMRITFENLLEKGIEETEYDELFGFISRHYPNNPQKELFLREINKLYLKSPNVSLEQKVDYMISHFNRVGPEAMIIIADQIHSIEDYRYFRERAGARLTSYIEGKDLLAQDVIAGGDFLSSFFAKEFEKLIVTCQDDPEVKKVISTDFAQEWFREMLYREAGNKTKNIVYDENLGRFILTDLGRSKFRTVTDLFSSLINSTDLQKFAIIHKSLTDQGGAFTSPEKRKRLSELVVASLKLNKGFLASVLTAACTEADAKLLGIPVSRMLVPLVFKGLSVDSIDIDDLGSNRPVSYELQKLEDAISKQSIADILKSDTRSISIFGARYQTQSNSLAAQLARESDDKFHTTTQALERLLLPKETGLENSNEATNIDPAVEAVIRGVETSGALGIRALQLATQFYSFPPALERRLSNTFDSNPGVNKLLFWENLNKLALDEAEKGNQQVEQFIQRITLGDYLGGGSLQTTHEAILDTGTPNERRVIVKMKNPNVQKFIEESYISAQDTLRVVSRQGGESAQHARVGMLLMDLSQKWCLDDINDKTFIEDDQAFRDVIAEFNQNEGQTTFYAPEKLFTTSQVKSEDLAAGKTANQFFNDANASFEQKQQVVRTLSRFFIHQLKGEAVIEEGGKRLHLVHSDPHIGNYMVDVSGQSPKIGVIDRSMYLKLEDADIRVLEKMVLPGNDNDFVYSFINRVLDVNKVRGIQRAVVTGQVITSLAGEYNRQKARGAVNKLDLMRAMISTLSDARHFTQFRLTRMDIPINLRLMIRNVGAFQELGRRYGLDFEALYREETA